MLDGEEGGTTGEKTRNSFGSAGKREKYFCVLVCFSSLGLRLYFTGCGKTMFTLALSLGEWREKNVVFESTPEQRERGREEEDWIPFLAGPLLLTRWSLSLALYSPPEDVLF